MPKIRKSHDSPFALGISNDDSKTSKFFVYLLHCQNIKNVNMQELG